MAVEIDPEGYFIEDVRGGYAVSGGMKYLTKFTEYDDAIKFIAQRMINENYFPDVYFVNERGTMDLLKLKVKHIKGVVVKVTAKIVS